MVNSGKFDAHWFKGQLADKGMSQRELARRLKMQASAITLTFQGKRALQSDEAAALAGILGQPVDVVLGKAGVRLPRSVNDGYMQLTGYIDDKGELHRTRIGGDGSRVAAPVGLPENAVAVRFHTAMSALDMWDGWIAFYVPSLTVQPDSFGRLSVVETKDGAKLVRVIRKGYDHGKFNLVLCGNPTTENAAIINSAPVLWLRP